MKRVFLIDGNSLANRAFYALPFLSNHDNRPSGAVFGFANLLIKLIAEEKPDEIIVAFDHARKTFRNDIYAEYKGTRKSTPEELKLQMPVIKKMLNLMKISIVEQEGIEADDCIGSLAEYYKKIEHVVIISGDRDLLQLIDENVEVWLTRKGLTEIQKLNEKNLVFEFGVKPSQVIELKALMGDSSDNIPGVSGVGEKTALKLLDDFGDIDNLYKNIDTLSGKLKEKLVNGKDMAYLSRQLATIKTNCELEVKEAGYDFPFTQEVFAFFKEWDCFSLLKRTELFTSVISDEQDLIFAKRIPIKKFSDIEVLLSKIETTFAYDLVKMEFAPNVNEIYFLEPVFDMFSDQISLDSLIAKLKSIFEDDKILKITYSSKEDIKKLWQQQISLKNFFDIKIAKYLVYAGFKLKTEDVPVNNYFKEVVVLQEKIEKDGLTKILYDCEFPLVKVLASMENDGFLIDENYLNKLDEEYSNQLKILEQEITGLAGEEFNLNSPKQMANILFNKLGLRAYANKKQSTNIEVLNDLIGQHVIIEKIINYRKLNKIKNTYIDVYKKICKEKGPLIHTIFNQTLTNTGRLSSSDPNLQNIPTKDDLGKNLRKLFISKFDGGKIMSADYNQIELRLLADMSGEEKLIESYKSGEDIHALTASQIFSVPLDEVSPSQRREAKAVNFGIIYGISDFGLSQSIKTSRKRAKQYIDSYFERYKKVKAFIDQNVEYARNFGFIKTKYGRIRHIPEINSSNHNTRNFAERVAMNMPLQGTASDIIKFAMIEVYEKLKPLKSQLILQIHDELIIDVYKGEEEEVRKILVEQMENVVKLSVPLPVSIGFGNNLFECK